MRYRILYVGMAILIASSSLFSAGQFALANTELEKEIKHIQTERSDTKKEAELAEAEIKKVQEEKKAVEAEVRKIDHQVADTTNKIRTKRDEIAGVQVDIEELQEEIKIIEERIAERDKLLKERARTMYQNGGTINYLEVILGAKSFSDFLDRISAISIIAQQDRNILDAHIEDQRLLQEAKVKLEEELKKLENHLIELEQLMKNLEAQRKQKETLMNKLEQQENQLHADLGELEEADAILAAQERAMKQELEAFKERQRQLELERQRQLELERQRQLEAERSGTPQPEPSRSVASTPAVTAEGTFMRPTTGAISSPYGMRWGRMHHGIDIGKGGRTGDVPVVAVEAGTVIRSYYSPSYGNTVMISHNVNGQVITTLYAHLENRSVSDGQRVSKGQLLGYMGNTGRSFGPHLHFEVHEGPWTGDKRYAVNPLKYIPN